MENQDVDAASRDSCSPPPPSSPTSTHGNSNHPNPPVQSHSGLHGHTGSASHSADSEGHVESSLRHCSASSYDVADDDHYVASGNEEVESLDSRSTSTSCCCRSSMLPPLCCPVHDDPTVAACSCQDRLHDDPTVASSSFQDRLEERGEEASVGNEDSDQSSSSDDEEPAAYTPRYTSLHPTLDGWKTLPAILLEDVFLMLTPKQRHQASMVCRSWYEMFYSPRVWETFVLWERTLTKRRFNLYKGYQRELCPRKTQLCLMRVGHYFKRIIVTAISDYYNLYEFLRILSSFLSFHPTFPMPLLSTFRFTFACESRGVNGTVIIGTGGNILSKLKDLVVSMQQLHHLALNELLLEVKEVDGLLAAAASSSTESLHYLELLNCTKVPLPMCEVTQFTQLVTLKLSPQHLNEEVILLLGGTQLLHLHVVQDAYTCSCDPVSSEAWKLFREMAPSKRVFLQIQGRTKTPLLLQPHAPVRGVVFRTPYHRLHPELVTWLVEYYAKTLEFFVQERLPRTHGSRKFAERGDQSLLRLVRSCPRLHTVVVRERLSLATMLLLAKEGHGLKSLTLRRNALLKKCEWPKAESWSDEFFRWLKTNGRDYDRAFQQMPLIMNQPWKPAVDKTFKHLTVHVT